MRIVVMLLAASALLVSALPDAQAAPGDVVVPAHRTRDGHWVPANVPPISGGTHLARRPARSAKAHRTSRSSTPAPARSQRLMPPLLVEAQPVRR
jgi:hypothetical protein